MKNIDIKGLVQGLQIARFSFVLVALLSLLGTVVSSLNQGLLSNLPVLLTVVFGVGLGLCLKASPGVGRPWIAGALVMAGFAVAVHFMPTMWLLRTVSFLGGFGLILARVVAVFAPFLSVIFFLMYLSSLGRCIENSEVAGHFLRLAFIPAVIILALLGSGFVPTDFAILVPIGSLVVGLMFVVSYSGAIAKLVRSLED